MNNRLLNRDVLYWWYQCRHIKWQREFLYWYGFLISVDSFGPANDLEKKLAEAQKMIAEGKTIYYRLKLGLEL